MTCVDFQLTEGNSSMLIIKGKESRIEMKYCFISLVCCVQYLVSYKSSWNLEEEHPRGKIQAT
jgi:hypothetical protein